MQGSERAGRRETEFKDSASCRKRSDRLIGRYAPTVNLIY